MNELFFHNLIFDEYYSPKAKYLNNPLQAVGAARGKEKCDTILNSVGV